MRAIAKPHTHKNGLDSGKNQGNLPPPPGTPEIPNIRWFNRGNPRNPRKITKNHEKIRKKWGIRGVGGSSPVGPKVPRPTCRLNGPMGNITLDQFYAICHIINTFVFEKYATSGVFWGGIRYSLHVFSGDHWNVPYDITRDATRKPPSRS